MLQFDTQNLDKINSTSPTNSLSKSEIDQYLGKFDHFYDLILSRKQGFLDLPKQDISGILEFAQNVQGKYTDIVILGIGGSMLGPQCLLEIFKIQIEKEKNFPNSNAKIPQIHCLDNIDPDQISHLSNSLNLQKTLILVQTKSGTTPETLAQYFYFHELIEKEKLETKEHFVFITDPEIGYLRQIANEENITSFEIPANVGGRFSVLSPVGLLVSALVGLDIAKILKGAQNCLKANLLQEIESEIETETENKNNNGLKSAFRFAIIQFLLSKKGKTINVLMPYSSRLRLLANWYTQLLSESIGKEFDLSGKIVNSGITPLPALGATDQHSQLQLFKEGPNDKLLIFIEVLKTTNLPISTSQLPKEFDYLNDTTFGQLLAAELMATKTSLTESNRPNVTLTLSQINEMSVGNLLMFLQLSVAFLGELLEINTFDQTGVERSKVLTREFLAK